MSNRNKVSGHTLAPTPEAYLEPFDPLSAWRKPLAQVPSASYHPALGVADLHVGLANWANTSIPMFRATGADPRVKVLHHPDAWWMVHSGKWKQTGNAPAVEAQIRRSCVARFPYPSHAYLTQVANVSGSAWELPDRYDRRSDPASAPLQIHAPVGVYPVRGNDGHLVVFQPDGRAFEAFAAVILADGTIVCPTYNITNPALARDGWQNGVRASMIPVYAGLIRKDEVAAGVIPHAIAMVLPAGRMATAWAHPALAFDRGALKETPPYAGPFPMGARLALPRNLDIRSLGLGTKIGRAIAKALQAYGAILVDRGGDGCTFVVEDQASGIGYSWAIQSDLIAILQRLLYVTTGSKDFLRSDTSPAEPTLAVTPTAPFANGVIARATPAGTTVATIQSASDAVLALIYDPRRKLAVEGRNIRLTEPLAAADGASLPFALRASRGDESRIVTFRFAIA